MALLILLWFKNRFVASGITYLDLKKKGWVERAIP
jgi:hypothetical protein